jgi:predicted DNA-binding protein YlxM (UPF0122 family)
MPEQLFFSFSKVLGLSLAEIGRRLSISRPAVRAGVARGEKILKDREKLSTKLVG